MLGLAERVHVAHGGFVHAEDGPEHRTVQEIGVEHTEALGRVAREQVFRVVLRLRHEGRRFGPGQGEGVGPARTGHAGRRLAHGIGAPQVEAGREGRFRFGG